MPKRRLCGSGAARRRARAREQAVVQVVVAPLLVGDIAHLDALDEAGKRAEKLIGSRDRMQRPHPRIFSEEVEPHAAGLAHAMRHKVLERRARGAAAQASTYEPRNRGRARAESRSPAAKLWEARLDRREQ